MPRAPRARCRSAISTHLWVLMCGRKETPSEAQRPAIRLRLRSRTSRSRSSAGVGTRSKDIGVSRERGYIIEYDPVRGDHDLTPTPPSLPQNPELRLDPGVGPGKKDGPDPLRRHARTGPGASPRRPARLAADEDRPRGARRHHG